MKICYLANADSIHTQRWVKYFADKGHEVHLISSRPFGDCSIKNVKLHLTKRLHLQIKFISFIINLLIEIIQIRKLIKKIKPDVVHAHYVVDYGFRAALANFHPFILSVWGSDVLVAPRKSYFIKMMVKYALNKADVVVPTAKFMKDYLVKEFKLSEKKIIRIPWGIDLKIFHRGYKKEVEKLKKELKINSKKWIILSPRGMRPNYSNNHLILDVIPYVIESHPGTIFIFLRGNGSAIFEKELEEKVSELGIKNNVRFIPHFLSPQEMAIYYNMSNIFVSIPYTDQFASTIMEGMVCGSIPIVSNIEVYRQYLEDGKNAFFVDPDDPKDIAKKIIYCIEHPEIKDKVYIINKKIIEENENWNKNAKKIEGLYEKFR